MGDQVILAGSPGALATDSLEIQRRVERDSQLRERVKYRSKPFQRVPIDLSKLGAINNPLRVSFPFNALEVISFVDTTGANDFVNFVKFVPGQADSYNMNNYRECRLGEVIEFDEILAEGQLYIDTPLGSGAQCVVIFYLDAKARSAAINAKISGFLSQTDGSSRNSAGLTGGVGVITVTGTAGSATKILDADSARSVANLRVEGGDVLLGDSAIGTVSGQGDKRLDGERWDDRNTGALYAIVLSGTPKIYGLINK